MIITCPKCSSQFKVPEGAIPKEGRLVKCTDCTHEWHTGKEKVVRRKPWRKLANIHAPFLPFKREKMRTSKEPCKVLKIVCVVNVCMALFAGSVLHREKFPFLNPAYSLIGLNNLDKVAFTELNSKSENNGDAMEISLSGMIRNESSNTKHVPHVKITVLSKGEREIGVLHYPVIHTTLLSGQNEKIAPEITNISSAAETLLLDVGNKWDLFFRR